MKFLWTLYKNIFYENEVNRNNNTIPNSIGRYWIMVHSELLFRKTNYLLRCHFLFLCNIIALSHNYTAIKLYCQLILLRFIYSIFRQERCNSYPLTNIQYISSLRVYRWLDIKKMIVIERYKSLVYNIHWIVFVLVMGVLYFHTCILQIALLYPMSRIKNVFEAMMITYTKDSKTAADFIIIACEKEEKRQHRKKDWESSEMILSIKASVILS